MRFDENFIRGALPNAVTQNVGASDGATFSIDTRTLQQGDIFVAIKGSKFNGHDFIMDALKKGAGGLIIEKNKKSLLDKIPSNVLREKLVLFVDDTPKALVSLACAWRKGFSYPVAAITGSVGKTSTKAMVANIIKRHGIKALISHGTQNTKLGIALNMLRMRSWHELAFFEVGISRRGEMAELAQLLRPKTAVITSVGHAHMEGLGSLADIAIEKRDIFKFFTQESVGIINGDLPVLSDIGYVHPVLKFGTKTTNQIQARKITVGKHGTSLIIKIYKKKYPVMLRKVHQGVVFNALAATSLTHYLGIPDDIIIAGIQDTITIPGRFEQRKLKKNKGVLINDSYNANPESMKASLLAFQQLEIDGKKIAVLGDMLDLGVNSPFWHRQLGRFLYKVSSLSEVILVGSMIEWTKKTIPVGIKVTMVSTWQEATKQLEQDLNEYACVLVKGSNAIGLNNLVEQVSIEK